MARASRKKVDEALLMALACGATAEAAARQCRLSERTVYRRRADPEFRRRLQSLRAEMVQRTAGMLTAAGMEAVKSLLGLLAGSSTPSVRLGAARAVLELGVRQRESAELEERVAALERHLSTVSPVESAPPGGSDT